MKNMSVFPKLLVIIRELDIVSEVVEAWNKRTQKLIKKKESLVELEKYEVSRM